MALFELKAEIPAQAAAAADEVFLEHGCENWRVIEDVIAGRAWVAGVGGTDEEVSAQWQRISPLLAAAGAQPLESAAPQQLADTDWRDSYKAHFHAWQFGRLHWVPIWEKDKYTVPPGEAALWLDPGLAFGTGNHETTRLCVERLVARTAEHGSTGQVIDAGCGSGILALSAVLLGYQGVIAFDNDPEAVRISEENATLNELTGSVQFSVGDLVSGLAGRSADVLLANIQADVLMRFAEQLVRAIAPGGTLILSGILASENSQVRNAFESHTAGWTINARFMGEWSDIVLTKSGR